LRGIGPDWYPRLRFRFGFRSRAFGLSKFFPLFWTLIPSSAQLIALPHWCQVLVVDRCHTMSKIALIKRGPRTIFRGFSLILHPRRHLRLFRHAHRHFHHYSRAKTCYFRHLFRFSSLTEPSLLLVIIALLLRFLRVQLGVGISCEEAEDVVGLSGSPCSTRLVIIIVTNYFFSSGRMFAVRFFVSYWYSLLLVRTVRTW